MATNNCLVRCIGAYRQARPSNEMDKKALRLLYNRWRM